MSERSIQETNYLQCRSSIHSVVRTRGRARDWHGSGVAGVGTDGPRLSLNWSPGPWAGWGEAWGDAGHEQQGPLVSSEP